MKDFFLLTSNFLTLEPIARQVLILGIVAGAIFLLYALFQKSLGKILASSFMLIVFIYMLNTI